MVFTNPFHLAALKSLKDSLPPKLLAGGSREVVHGRTSQSLPQLAHSSKETTKAAATDSCEGRKFPSPNKFSLECLGDLSGSKPEDNIPARIELDPTVADVIIFGRLSFAKISYVCLHYQIKSNVMALKLKVVFIQVAVE